jgi:hypothetical protein
MCEETYNFNLNPERFQTFLCTVIMSVMSFALFAVVFPHSQLSVHVVNIQVLCQTLLKLKEPADARNVTVLCSYHQDTPLQGNNLEPLKRRSIE